MWKNDNVVCGYIYDYEADDPHSFENLSDWVCPMCGAPKDQFEKISS